MAACCMIDSCKKYFSASACTLVASIKAVGRSCWGEVQLLMACMHHTQTEVEDGPNDEGENYTRVGRLSDPLPRPYPNEEAARCCHHPFASCPF